MLRARFAPERPGELALQVIADVSGGPRPVLEATVFVDVDPPPSAEEQAAPGELTPEGPDDQRLIRMLDGARASVGLPPLPRDPRLDDIARAAVAHWRAHGVEGGYTHLRETPKGADARA